jgi:MYXO-CTERM domain-containing protein
MPYEPEEDALAAGALATSTTDLDDDGRADLCVRAAAGIRCALANGAPFGEIVVGPALGDGRGWSDRTNYETLAMGDVTGDGLADVCARANAGVRCWPSTGAGFDDAIVGPELSDAVGWSRPEHYATIRLADVDGDDRDDVCARAAAGFVCWPSTGTGFAAGWAPVAALSNDAGFAAPDRWATIRMGDVDGDGRDDVCARGAGGFDCWRSNGSGFDATPIEGPRWGDGHWRSHSRYSTIRMGDVDGDGRDDACARGALGYRCHLATGSGFGDAIVLEALSNDRGWTDITNYSTIHLADVDGDRDLDVCARGDRGILCWPFEGSGFGAETTGPELSDDSGWARPIYYRTIRFADIDGDGDDDLCARAAAGIRCWLADGGRFGEGLVGPEWSDEAGFWPLRHHTTMRLAGPVRAFVEPPPPEGDGGPSGDAGPTLGPSDDAGRPRSDAAGPEPSRGPGAGPTSGCACSTSGPASPWPIWSLLVMAGAWRKRR